MKRSLLVDHPTDKFCFNNLRWSYNNGYFMCSKLGVTFHRYLWELFNGEIPPGYVIHHIDFNKLNNDLSNLKCIKAGDHARLHATLSNNKAVICLETSQVFRSIVSAATSVNCLPDQISRCCRGKAKSCHKLHWEFYNPAIKYTSRYFQAKLQREVIRRPQNNKSTNRKVQCVETGRIFDFARLAGDWIGCHRSSVRKSATEGSPCRGYHFLWV